MKKFVICGLIFLFSYYFINELHAQILNFNPFQNKLQNSLNFQDSGTSDTQFDQFSKEDPISKFIELKYATSVKDSVDNTIQPYMTSSHSDKSSILIFENTQKDRVRANRQISMFGLIASYAAPLIVDGIAFPNDHYYGYLLIPVIGPFIHIEKAGNDYYYNETLKGLLILDGVAQMAFATFFVISLSKNPETENLKKLTIFSSINSLTLKIQF